MSVGFGSETVTDRRHQGEPGRFRLEVPFRPLLAYQGVPVLVTGASGFIGGWVARLLSQCGAELALVGRDRDRLQQFCELSRIQARTITVDLAEPGAFSRAYTEVSPAITFNLAGYGVDRGERDEALAWRLNAELVHEMALVIGASNSPWRRQRMVHAGSALEYGPARDVSSEETTPQPTTLYGKSKLQGSEYLQTVCSKTGLQAVAARVFTVYGPGEHASRLLPSLIQAARSSEPLALTGGEQKRDFIFVRDVAEGLLRLGLVSQARAPVVNLATGELTSVRVFAETAAELLEMRQGHLRFGELSYRDEEMWHAPVDTSGLERLLGWKPSASVREGIQQTIAFETGETIAPDEG